MRVIKITIEQRHIMSSLGGRQFSIISPFCLGPLDQLCWLIELLSLPLCLGLSLQNETACLLVVLVATTAQLCTSHIMQDWMSSKQVLCSNSLLGVELVRDSFDDSNVSVHLRMMIHYASAEPLFESERAITVQLTLEEQQLYKPTAAAGVRYLGALTIVAAGF